MRHYIYVFSTHCRIHPPSPTPRQPADVCPSHRPQQKKLACSPERTRRAHRSSPPAFSSSASSDTRRAAGVSAARRHFLSAVRKIRKIRAGGLSAQRPRLGSPALWLSSLTPVRKLACRRGGFGRAAWGMGSPAPRTFVIDQLTMEMVTLLFSNGTLYVCHWFRAANVKAPSCHEAC